MNKKIDLKYSFLIFIETFSIWQMGIIFYSAKSLTINNLVDTSVNLDYSIIVIALGYILGVLFIYFFPKKTILLGRIVTILSLVASLVLFLPISQDLFALLYYLIILGCVFFVAINMSIIVNYYTPKTALADLILAGITTSIGVAFCQNQIVFFSFQVFHIISTICIVLMIVGLFQIDVHHDIKFLDKKAKIKTPPRKLTVGLMLILAIACLNTLFTSALAEPIKNGVSVSYLGGLVASVLFYFFYKFKRTPPAKICTYYFAVIATGFLLYLTPNKELVYFSLFLQGFGYLLILVPPYFGTLLFEVYPFRLIAPLATIIAFITVIAQAILVELFRTTPDTLFLLYAFVSIFVTIMYLLFERNFDFSYLSTTPLFERLSKREKEVANLLIKGYSAKEISNILFISEYTAKDHIKSIYKKYAVNSKIKFIETIKNEVK